MDVREGMSRSSIKDSKRFLSYSLSGLDLLEHLQCMWFHLLSCTSRKTGGKKCVSELVKHRIEGGG